MAVGRSPAGEAVNMPAAKTTLKPAVDRRWTSLNHHHVRAKVCICCSVESYKTYKFRGATESIHKISRRYFRSNSIFRFSIFWQNVKCLMISCVINIMLCTRIGLAERGDSPVLSTRLCWLLLFYTVPFSSHYSAQINKCIKQKATFVRDFTKLTHFPWNRGREVTQKLPPRP